MDDLIMMIMIGLAFVITQIGSTGLIYMWHKYRYDFGGEDLDEGLRKKANGEVLGRVIRFKPQRDARVEGKNGKFGNRGFERRVWK